MQSIQNYISEKFNDVENDNEIKYLNNGDTIYIINAMYEKLGTKHYHSIKDDLDISLEYKREKSPITGEELEYIRIFVTFNIVTEICR